MDEASSDEEEEARRPTMLAPRLNPAPVAMPVSQSQPPPLPPVPDKVLVKKGYDPKQGANNTQSTRLNCSKFCFFGGKYLRFKIKINYVKK